MYIKDFLSKAVAVAVAAVLIVVTTAAQLVCMTLYRGQKRR